MFISKVIGEKRRRWQYEARAKQVPEQKDRAVR